MTSEDTKTSRPSISTSKIRRELKSRRILFFKVWGIVFVLSCLYIFPQPRYYTSEVSLAPEVNDESAMGSISSIASSFGLNLGGAAGTDAIYPELYPDLMSSTDFIIGLFDIPVTTLDGSISTDLYTYETKYQKTAFYNIPFIWISKQLSSLKGGSGTTAGKGVKVKAVMLTEKQDIVVKKLQGDITCTVDKLTSVFKIKVKAQDPLVAATLVDSVRQRLQAYITNYRTSKARIDVEHYEKLLNQAKADYKKAQREYSAFCDANQEVTLQSVNSKRDDLENEMQLNYNIYTTLVASLQAAKAKLQQQTPAFTVLQNSSVPLKPAGPKRMIFIIVMMLAASVGTCVYVLRKDLLSVISFFGK